MATGFVEVRVEGGGWKVTAWHAGRQPEVLGHYRRKRNAVLIGQGAAKALHVELKVTDRKGRYTTAAASYGNDPREVRG